MILDISRYRGNKDGLMRMYNNIPEPDKLRKITLVAIATHTPIIAIHQYVLEEHGEDSEIRSSMERLMNYYKITGLE